MKPRVIVIGISWGGMQALKTLLPMLPADFDIPIIIVQHMGTGSGNEWIDILDRMCLLKVKEADEKEKIKAGIVYIAAANYHLLIEKDYTFSLSCEERVNFARPSIDVLFECAAEVYKNNAVGIILTGLNVDGARGLLSIKEGGGIAIVQDPVTAQASEMPFAAIQLAKPQYIVPLDGIVPLLLKLKQVS